MPPPFYQPINQGIGFRIIYSKLPGQENSQGKILIRGLEVVLGGTEFNWHVQGPGFYPYQRKF
jgi:hypothetical protein